MPLDLLYLWAVSLLVIVGLLYLWMRLRMRRQNPALSDTTPENRDWFARLVLFISRLVKRPFVDNSSLSEFDSERSDQSTIGRASLVPVEALRLPVSIVLAAGIVLLWMGQTIYSKVPQPERRWVVLLMVWGGVAFLLAGQIAVRQTVLTWLARPVRQLCAYFKIQAGQLVLLLFAPVFAWMATLAAGDAFLARHWFISVLAWLVSIGLAIAGSLQWGEARQVKISRSELLFTAGLFLVAFLLRGVATNIIPPTFSGDEGSAGLSALLFVEGKMNNLFTIGWFSFPSFYFAVQSIGIRLLGQTIAALRVPSAAAGGLAVVATYWLARSLFDRKTAVLAGLYMMASHYHMHISRIGLNNIWDSFFGALAILGFWHGWKTGRRAWYVLCGVAIGIGQYFYVSIRVLPILLLVWSVAAFWLNREKFRRQLPGMLLAAFIAFIIVLPLGWFFWNHPHEFNAPLTRVTIMGERLQQEVLFREQSATSILIEQFTLAVSGFTRLPLRLLYDPGAPLLLTGAATLFLLAIAWCVTHFDLRYWLMLLPLLGAIASNTMSQSPPASQRYILAMPLVAIFVAVPLGLAGNWLDRLWTNRRHAGLVVTAVFMLAVIAQDLNYYFFKVYDSYILGGINTLVATDIAYYLADQEPEVQDVYFFGAPRMGYYSLSTIPYLVPHIRGEDVIEPLHSPPEWELDGPTLFIFLPERAGELEQVRKAYDNGRFREFYTADDLFLFAVYEVLEEN